MARTFIAIMPSDKKEKRLYRLWIALAALLGLSAFMYVSIMYKIINYGP